MASVMRHTDNNIYMYLLQNHQLSKSVLLWGLLTIWKTAMATCSVDSVGSLPPQFYGTGSRAPRWGASQTPTRGDPSRTAAIFLTQILKCHEIQALQALWEYSHFTRLVSTNVLPWIRRVQQKPVCSSMLQVKIWLKLDMYCRKMYIGTNLH